MDNTTGNRELVSIKTYVNIASKIRLGRASVYIHLDCNLQSTVRTLFDHASFTHYLILLPGDLLPLVAAVVGLKHNTVSS